MNTIRYKNTNYNIDGYISIGKIKRDNWYDCTDRYYKDDMRHRIGNPAAIYANGTILYCHHDEYHRLTGPAVIHANGNNKYYIHGKRIYPKVITNKKELSAHLTGI